MSDAGKKTSPQEDNPDYYPDGSPEPHTYLSAFWWAFALSMALAAPFLYALIRG
jgi:hypothetical protein